MSVGVEKLTRVFFVPTGQFISYLERQWPSRCVVDVGAGMGFLSQQLSLANFKVLSIDILPRQDAYVEVVELDATELQFPKMCLPLLCRPCHGGFPEATIENAFRTVSDLLYVSLPKNIERDLGWAFGKYRMTMEAFEAGQDGEIAVWLNKV